VSIPVKRHNASSAIKNYRVHFEKMVTAINAIENSDLIVNVLAKKLDDKNLKEILKNVTKKYPDQYVQSLFLINAITLLEVYLKDRIIEEFNNNSNAVDRFLHNYDCIGKITVDDIINGPVSFAIKSLEGIIFHNLPKVEKIYAPIFDMDLKNMADYKLLNLSVRYRHSFVHENGKLKGKIIRFGNRDLQNILNEITIFVENIDFFIIHKRKKARHLDYYRKFRIKERLFHSQDHISYEYEKFGGI